MQCDLQRFAVVNCIWNIWNVFTHLWNTNEDLFDEIWELSVPPLTATQLPFDSLKS